MKYYCKIYKANMFYRKRTSNIFPIPFGKHSNVTKPSRKNKIEHEPSIIFLNAEHIDNVSKPRLKKEKHFSFAAAPHDRIYQRWGNFPKFFLLYMCRYTLSSHFHEPLFFYESRTFLSFIFFTAFSEQRSLVRSFSKVFPARLKNFLSRIDKGATKDHTNASPLFVGTPWKHSLLSPWWPNILIKVYTPDMIVLVEYFEPEISSTKWEFFDGYVCTEIYLDIE